VTPYAKFARNMITVYGMSKQAPNISLVDHQQGLFLGQVPHLTQHSEKLGRIIDDEIQEIIQNCYADAKQLLLDKRVRIEEMAKALLGKEKMDESTLVILSPRNSKKGNEFKT